MTPQRPISRVALATFGLVLLVPVLVTVLMVNAGDLTPPPGAPSPTMKTLDEIEARTPVQSLSGDANSLYIIDQPGSYYLTDNITGEAGKNGILITVGDVTLDLNGFALIGVSSSYDGVILDDGTTAKLTDVTVCNGSIRGWGIYGIRAVDVQNGRIADITVSSPDAGGIEAHNCIVTACVAYESHASSWGIVATGGVMSHCAAFNCLGYGLLAQSGALLTQSTAKGNGTGIVASGGAIVRDCTATDNTVNYSVEPGSFGAARPVHTLAGDANSIYVIDEPGSYCLTHNITGVSGKHGIVITADEVTLDLGGFSLVGAAGAAHGIWVSESNTRNVTIRNGFIRSWPLLQINGQSIARGTIENVHTSGLGGGGVAVKHCIITGCSFNDSSDGGLQGEYCKIFNCTAHDNVGTGIYAPFESVVSGCTAVGNAIGISGSAGTVVENNSVQENATGISVGYSCLVVRNNARGNTTVNYNIDASSSHGPIVNVAGVGDISGTTGADHPWANFEY